MMIVCWYLVNGSAQQCLLCVWVILIGNFNIPHHMLLGTCLPLLLLPLLLLHTCTPLRGPLLLVHKPNKLLAVYLNSLYGLLPLLWVLTVLVDAWTIFISMTTLLTCLLWPLLLLMGLLPTTRHLISVFHPNKRLYVPVVSRKLTLLLFVSHATTSKIRKLFWMLVVYFSNCGPLLILLN